MTTGILGCALVAGLMTFAAAEAQAGVVINNQLYSPLKLKITAQYINSKGKAAKMSISSKEILKDLGYNSNVKLAVSRDTGHVWTINKDVLMNDLSGVDGNLFVDLSWVDYGYSGKNNQVYTEVGTTSVDFYDDGSFAGTESSNWFQTSGTYTYTDNDGPAKNGSYTDKESYKAPALSGNGYFSNASFDAGDAAVTGSASYNGNGKLPALAL